MPRPATARRTCRSACGAGFSAPARGRFRSEVKLDLHGKRPIYAREGVEHLWLVDPADRTLEALELREGQWVLIASAEDADPVCIRPFDAVTFSLGGLWP